MAVEMFPTGKMEKKAPPELEDAVVEAEGFTTDVLVDTAAEEEVDEEVIEEEADAVVVMEVVEPFLNPILAN
jgi:hypothetical protein